MSCFLGPPSCRAERSEIPVEFRRVQTEYQSGVPTICRVVLLRVCRCQRQRVSVSRGDTFLRGGSGPVLWERV